MQEKAMISLAGVTKVFYTDDLETHALDGIHLDVAQGEFLSISGPSGCGKSTLLAILGLLDSPTEGKYAARRPRGRRAHAGCAREGAQRAHRLHLPGLQPDRRPDGAAERRAAPDLPRGMTADERRKAALHALERVGMSHRVNHHPAQLSGGQQQRVAVARALAGKPAILLADEPTGNLDSRNGEAVMNLLRELHREGSTICMVTHDPRYADYADRKVQLFDGRVVDESTLIDLSQRRAAKA